jgi:hypothetical protein
MNPCKKKKKEKKKKMLLFCPWYRHCSYSLSSSYSSSSSSSSSSSFQPLQPTQPPKKVHVKKTHLSGSQNVVSIYRMNGVGKKKKKKKKKRIVDFDRAHWGFFWGGGKEGKGRLTFIPLKRRRGLYCMYVGLACYDSRPLGLSRIKNQIFPKKKKLEISSSGRSSASFVPGRQCSEGRRRGGGIVAKVTRTRKKIKIKIKKINKLRYA